MAQQFLADRNGWLSFRSSTPLLYITAEDAEFDVHTMKAWRDEGFVVEYIPMGNGGKQYVQTLHKLGENMSIGERYAIVGIRPFLSLAHWERPLAVSCSPRKHSLTVNSQLLETQLLCA